MRLVVMLLALFCGLASAAGPSLLVRVDFSSGSDLAAIVADGVDVLARFDGWCIVRADQAGLARLDDCRDCIVLDDYPESRMYVFVSTPPGFDAARLNEFGAALTGDKDGVLLRTTAAGIVGLHRLPVDLYTVSMRPMYVPTPRAAAPRVPKAAPVPDSLVWTLVNRVNQDSLEARLRRMIAFQTRYAPTESCYSAVSWMLERLAAYGCDSTYPAGFLSGYAPNAVGIRFGKVNPQHIFAVTAHIDATSRQDPYNWAPGSDDNASGCGLVLEAARVCADVDFASTVWFIGFSAEEWGLWGSDSFLYKCWLRGDSILAAFNSDMISYGRDDTLTVVHTTRYPQTESLARFFLAQADTFTSLQVKDTVIDASTSDEYSFWKYGYLAIRGRYHDKTPNYHSAGDTIGPFHYADCGTNNLPMYTEMVKAVVATIAKWAGVMPSGVAEPEQCPAPAVARIVPSVGQAPVHISFSSPASAASVYSATGRLVRRLGAGSSLTWDGRDTNGASVAPGVYYVRTAGSSSRFVLAE
ncbi:M28 family peptidase [candidate division WOR-3 bacterium]|nr:M28 family peptidase [candidate division WOR-3 bacterium]